MIKNLVLHGAKNPHIIKICKRAGLLESILCFMDNSSDICSFMGYSVFTPEKIRAVFPSRAFRVCNLVTGSTHARHSVYEQLKGLGFTFTSIVDPSVDLHLVKHGESCYIQEQVSLQVGVVLGNNVSIHAGTIIGHETRVGSSSFIAHGCCLSGEVIINDQVFIGAGASVHPRKTIGIGSIVAAGSVVTKNIPDYEVWMGNPARRLKAIQH
jgi:sugar O-acyltransferase (sialic acid O-acetyltransferase NeuD family)